MRRLYLKIYLAILGSLMLVVLIAGLVWHLGGQQRTLGEAYEIAGDILDSVLPDADAPETEQQAAVDDLAARMDRPVALYDRSRRLLATTDPDLPQPPERGSGGWTGSRSKPGWAFSLPGERWLVVGIDPAKRRPVIALVIFLGIIAVVVGISAFPVARGLTRRLERLKTGVETLGAGDLAARVKVEGKDEVAHLAESFNLAATRIEELVEANRMMLANASHELRTPLSRIRIGIDLFEKRPNPELKAELQGNIAELDRLIDEILLASRLDASPDLTEIEEIDLQALCAEECARIDRCDLSGEAVTLRGDPHLFRRLIRNLLDNATHHGKPPIRVVLRSDGTTISLAVLDHGGGIPADERERIFLPFKRLGGKQPGAGLGLALVRQIARLHGGDASVWRDEKSGLNGFRIILPASA